MGAKSSRGKATKQCGFPSVCELGYGDSYYGNRSQLNIKECCSRLPGSDEGPIILQHPRVRTGLRIRNAIIKTEEQDSSGESRQQADEVNTEATNGLQHSNFVGLGRTNVEEPLDVSVGLGCPRIDGDSRDKEKHFMCERNHMSLN